VSDAAARCADRPPAAWGALVATHPAATPAHRPELWEAIAATHAGFTGAFLNVEEHGAWIGGAPVMFERRGPFAWAHALPWLLTGAPLAAPGREAVVDVAVARGMAEAACARRVIGGAWTCYRPAGEPVAPPALEGVGGETRTLDTAVVDLSAGIEAAWRRVDRKSRSDLRRARERLAFAETPAGLSEAYVLHVAQGRAWPHHRSRPMVLSARLLAVPSPLGPVARLFTVSDARGPLAAAFTLDHPREIMVWWSGARPEARRVNGFGRLMWGIVEWAAAVGRARVNLGASGGLESVAAFKRSLGARVVPTPVRWLDAGAAGVPGRALAAAQRWWRRGRHRGGAA
jgi:GNAT acetyltransferase-like protein